MSCEQDPRVIGGLLGRCDHLVHMRMDRRLRRYGVSPMQCRSLVFLHECGGAATQKQLQQSLMVKPSTVNGIVDRLEEKGLLRRSTDQTDGRRRVLRLTDGGCEFLDEFQIITREVADCIRKGFSQEETEQLRQLLLRVVENLQGETEEVEL